MITGTEPVFGFVDLLPEQAALRRRVEAALTTEIAGWGYRPLETPIVEDAALVRRVLGEGVERGLLRLIDQDGTVLALVGERTLPVARVVAGQLRSESLPIRLFYSAPVSGQDLQRSPRRRAGYHVGAELIGAGGARADAECVALALHSLRAAGLGNCQLDVGHAGFFRGLLEGLGGGPELQAAVTGALAGRDFVALDRALAGTPLRTAEHELMVRFPTLRGGTEILEAAVNLVQNPVAEQALAELAQVFELLAEHGVADNATLDLGAIRDFDYYTGVIFEAFSPELGRAVAAGGRYDQLLASFGTELPATGFVVHLEVLEEALRQESRGEGPGPAPARVLLGYGSGDLAAAVSLAQELRRAGLAVEMELEPSSAPEVLARAGERSCRTALHLEAGTLSGAAAGEDQLQVLDRERALALAHRA